MESTEHIDAVEMTRRIREKHAAQLQGVTPEERIRFYREKAAWLEAEMRKGRRERRAAEPPSDARG
jgi:hypothetical protein